jgi:hypothetical protein|nr:Wadjet anti-phage system protein JetD domain-containing protein [Neorhizobium tomejilense]
MTSFVDLLVRKVEERPGTKSVSMEVDWQKFHADHGSSPAEITAMKDELAILCDTGILKPRYRKGAFREIDKVTVLDRAALYEALGRLAASDTARQAVAVLRETAEEWEAPVLDAIEQTWAKHKSWGRFSINDVGELVTVQRIARGFRTGLNEGLDIRTFSAKLGGDSKFLERYESSIRAYCYFGQQKPLGSLRDIMERNGTVKISMPIILSGPFSLNGNAFGDMIPYCGVPYNETAGISLARRPDYVLTVENLVSFHRHVSEINGYRNGFILYSGGNPSRAFRDFYARLVTELADVPFYHWGDVDEGGLEIARSLMALQSELKPHLMSVELARSHGARIIHSLTDDGRFDGTWLEPMARYLAVPDNRGLEQEMIDPVLPV